MTRVVRTTTKRAWRLIAGVGVFIMGFVALSGPQATQRGYKVITGEELTDLFNIPEAIADTPHDGGDGRADGGGGDTGGGGGSSGGGDSDGVGGDDDGGAPGCP